MTSGWERTPALGAGDRRARELPSAARDAARVTRVRQHVLAASLGHETRSRRPLTKIAIGLLALAGAAVAATLLVRSQESGRVHNAVVEFSRGAQFAWVTSRPDEVLRLQEGVISVNITPLAPGERFRVLAGNGEVEARGGRLEVAVDGDRLFRVNASEAGTVVRINESAPITLSRGEEWSAPAKELEPMPPPPAPAQVQKPGRREHAPAPTH